MDKPSFQSQFELFPSSQTQGDYAQTKKQACLLKSLTLSPENLVIGCIIFVMTLVLAFSFGVERARTVMVDTQETASEKVGDEKANDGIITKSQNGASASDAQKHLAGETGPQSGEGASKTEVLKIPEIKEQDLSNQYTIQVASFKLKESAQQEAKKLDYTGHETFVLTKGSYVIVCVGKFPQRAQANAFSGKLKNKYRDLLVRRL